VVLHGHGYFCVWYSWILKNLSLKWLFRLARPGKNLVIRPGMQKNQLRKVMKIENNENSNQKNGESRNSCWLKVGGVGVEGMMTFGKIGVLVWDWRTGYHVWLCRCQRQIWVPTSATIHCGPIRILEGGQTDREREDEGGGCNVTYPIPSLQQVGLVGVYWRAPSPSANTFLGEIQTATLQPFSSPTACFPTRSEAHFWGCKKVHLGQFWIGSAQLQ